MAKELNEEEVIELLEESQLNATYPWRKWMNGSWWQIFEGEDYQVTTATMRNLMYRKQRKFGKIHTKRKGNSLIIKREVRDNGNNRRVKQY